jgi:hypothetical protein
MAKGLIVYYPLGATKQIFVDQPLLEEPDGDLVRAPRNFHLQGVQGLRRAVVWVGSLSVLIQLTNTRLALGLIVGGWGVHRGAGHNGV